MARALARVLAQTKTHGSVAAVGLACGAMTSVTGLAELLDLAGKTLKGQIRGRTVVDVNG